MTVVDGVLIVVSHTEKYDEQVAISVAEAMAAGHSVIMQDELMLLWSVVDVSVPPKAEERPR